MGFLIGLLGTSRFATAHKSREGGAPSCPVWRRRCAARAPYVNVVRRWAETSGRDAHHAGFNFTRHSVGARVQAPAPKDAWGRRPWCVEVMIDPSMEFIDSSQLEAVAEYERILLLRG